MASSANDSDPQDGITRRRASSGGWSIRPPQQTYEPGEVIAAKYQLQSVIGKGGMGSVWLARNLVLHVDIAIKLVDRQFAGGEAAQRLLVEARAAAQLGHPSIVRIHDFGRTHHEDPFIVMELLKGESLGDVIERKGSLPAVAAVRMLLPIVSALRGAHAKGIVHRDIKPLNIILVPEESGVVVPKLVDFGIAKVERQRIKGEGTRDRGEDPSRIATRLTQTGTLIGSPEYMSPEQARGDEVDEQTDIWALSVVLYEALTGSLPFDGESIDRLLISILADEPVPATQIVDCDERLWLIIEGGLRKRKKERWPNVRAFGEALAGWLVDQGVDTDVTGASLRQAWLTDRTSRAFGANAEPSSVVDAVIDDDPTAGNDAPDPMLAIPLATPASNRGAEPPVGSTEPVPGAPRDPTAGVSEPAPSTPGVSESVSSAEPLLVPRKKRRTASTIATVVLLAGAAWFGAWAVGAAKAPDGPPSSLPAAEPGDRAAAAAQPDDGVRSAGPAADSTSAPPVAAPRGAPGTVPIQAHAERPGASDGARGASAEPGKEDATTEPAEATANGAATSEPASSPPEPTAEPAAPSPAETSSPTEPAAAATGSGPMQIPDVPNF